MGRLPGVNPIIKAAIVYHKVDWIVPCIGISCKSIRSKQNIFILPDAFTTTPIYLNVVFKTGTADVDY